MNPKPDPNEVKPLVVYCAIGPNKKIDINSLYNPCNLGPAGVHCYESGFDLIKVEIRPVSSPSQPEVVTDKKEIEGLKSQNMRLFDANQNLLKSIDLNSKEVEKLKKDNEELKRHYVQPQILDEYRLAEKEIKHLRSQLEIAKRALIDCDIQTIRARLNISANHASEALSQLSQSSKEEVKAEEDNVDVTGHNLISNMYQGFKDSQYKMGCKLSGPGRGDCEHFIGLPGKSIRGYHDGDDDTLDVYGIPNGWCDYCWLKHQNDNVKRSDNHWEECARQHCNNEFYYRGLVEKIGKMFGEKAYICDSGERSEDVLNAKVPELVEELKSEVDRLKKLFEQPSYQTTLDLLAESEKKNVELEKEKEVAKCRLNNLLNQWDIYDDPKYIIEDILKYLTGSLPKKTAAPQTSEEVTAEEALNWLLDRQAFVDTDMAQEPSKRHIVYQVNWLGPVSKTKIADGLTDLDAVINAMQKEKESAMKKEKE